VHVLLEVEERLPAIKYGGTSRVVWWLGKALVELGHRVTFLALPGSQCDFACVIERPTGDDWANRIPDDIDLVHIHSDPDEHPELPVPQLTTFHGNSRPGQKHHVNTVFISANQAARNGGEVYVHHGLDFDAYPAPDLDLARESLVFLAKAAWKVKNVQGAIRIARLAGLPLDVAGGTRLNFNMGFRFTWDRNVSFHGMIDDQQKASLLNRASALLFPVRWHEPFGLAVIEALYFGCAVLGTPYGSLPELVPPDVGYLSASESELADVAKSAADRFSAARCHQYARDRFSAARMATDYVTLYEQVAGGQCLHACAPAAPKIPTVKYLPFVR